MSVVHFRAALEYMGGIVPELLPAAIAVDEALSPSPSEIAASGTLAINFGGITTASVVVIVGDRDFTYTLNGESANTVATKPRQIILMGVSVTSLSITNSDSSNVLKIKIFLGGT